MSWGCSSIPGVSGMAICLLVVARQALAVGRALGPRVLPELVVERPVLLDQEHDVLDRVLVPVDRRAAEGPPVPGVVVPVATGVPPPLLFHGCQTNSPMIATMSRNATMPVLVRCAGACAGTCRGSRTPRNLHGRASPSHTERLCDGNAGRVRAARPATPGRAGSSSRRRSGPPTAPCPIGEPCHGMPAARQTAGRCSRRRTARSRWIRPVSGPFDRPRACRPRTPRTRAPCRSARRSRPPTQRSGAGQATSASSVSGDPAGSRVGSTVHARAVPRLGERPVPSRRGRAEPDRRRTGRPRGSRSPRAPCRSTRRGSRDARGPTSCRSTVRSGARRREQLSY